MRVKHKSKKDIFVIKCTHKEAKLLEQALESFKLDDLKVLNDSLFDKDEFSCPDEVEHDCYLMAATISTELKEIDVY